MVAAALILASVVALIGIFASARMLLPEFYGFDPATTGSILLRASIVAVGTMAGILSKAIYEELQKATDDDFDLGAVLLGAVTTRRFVIALVVAPIVILAFLKALDDISSHLLVGLMAYQNGFFFRTVIEGGGQK